MAELLGVVASGISVASLAIQVFDSLQKIHVFWKSVEGAPKDIGDVIEELQLLGAVLSELLNQSKSDKNTPCALVHQCLQRCSKVLEDLDSIISQVNSGVLASKRKIQWSSIKAAMKKGDISNLRQRLEWSKSTLSLAINTYRLSLQQQQVTIHDLQATFQQQCNTFQQQYNTFQQQCNTSQQEHVTYQKEQTASIAEFLSIARQISEPSRILSQSKTQLISRAGIALKPTSPSTSNSLVTRITTKQVWFGFGWYRYRVKTLAPHSSRDNGLSSQGSDDDDTEIERSYIPAAWFSSRGFSLRSAYKWGSWQYALRSIRAVPDDSSIFDACRDGNIRQAIELLENRKATIHDTNSIGWGLLHFAAGYGHPKMCRWLIDQGVVGDANYYGDTPLHMAPRQDWLIPSSSHYISVERAHDVVRVLVEQGQLDPMAMNRQSVFAICVFASSMETFMYLVQQQDQYHIDLEQRNDCGESILGYMLCYLACIPSPNHHGLHLIRHFIQLGYGWHAGYIMWSICACLRSITTSPNRSSPFIGPGVSETDDLTMWLADLLAKCDWRRRCQYFLLLITHDYWGPESLRDTGVDRTPTIRLWLTFLRKASIDLHEHFHQIEEELPDKRVPDVRFVRQGIKRILEVEYGPDPDDITILVRDVREEIPLEESIPGAWSTGKTMRSELIGKEAEIVTGFEPTADWRVSSKVKDA